MCQSQFKYFYTAIDITWHSSQCPNNSVSFNLYVISFSIARFAIHMLFFFQVCNQSRAEQLFQRCYDRISQQCLQSYFFFIIIRQINPLTMLFSFQTKYLNYLCFGLILSNRWQKFSKITCTLLQWYV